MRGLVAAELPQGVLRDANDPRERFAALIHVAGQRAVCPGDGQPRVEALHRLGSGERSTIGTGRDDSHPELLDYLARDFVEHDYDLKHVARTILQSRLYQSQASMPVADDRAARRAAAVLRGGG